MPAKPKAASRNGKRSSSANLVNPAPAIDPRLARVHALIEDYHPHHLLPNSPLDGRLPDLLKQLLDRIDWSLVDVGAIKDLFTAATAPSNVPGEDDVDDRRSDVLSELARVADTEHRSICACCRRDGGARHAARDRQSDEFRELVLELQQLDPGSVQDMLVEAREIVASTRKAMS